MVVGVARRVTILVAVAALAAGTLLGSSGDVSAGGIQDEDGIRTDAGINGSVCNVEQTECAEFDHVSPDLVRTYSATDERAAGGDRSKATVRYDEVWGPDNEIRSITVTGHLETANSGGGRIDALAYFGLAVDDITTTISVSGNANGTLTGSEFVVSDVDFELEMACGDDEYTVEAVDDAGGSEPNSGAAAVSISRTMQPADEECEISMSGFVDASTNRPAPGESGSSNLDFSVTITFGEQDEPGCNGVSGTVYDGVAGSPHHNPLRGIRVELRRDGQRVGNAEPTDADGAFCLESFAGVVDPGDYRLRATLIDATHEPPLFETRYRDEAEALWTEVDVTIEDFGPEATTDVEFAVNANQPWLPDAANVHWQSERMVRWVTETAELAPAAIGSFVLQFDSTLGTKYSRSAMTARIGSADDDSRFTDRDEAGDEGPENLEWHEIGHHVAESLGIAPSSDPACAGRVPHGGWLNPSTCDSLMEGFPMYLATVASLDIDAGRGPGYADAVYSHFASLEWNNRRPWSTGTSSTGTVVYREDFAVAQLLWDLADDTPDEAGGIPVVNPSGPATSFLYPAADRVALGATNLVAIMGEIRPATIDDLYRGLAEHPAVPAALKTADVDLLPGEPMELGPLMEVFLMHGFHPVAVEVEPSYAIGDMVGRTDHDQGPAGLMPRSHVEKVAGASVLLTNGTTGSVAFEIAIESPDGAINRIVTVAAGSSTLAYVEPEPYWGGVLPEAGPPACGAEGLIQGIVIRVGSPGTPPREVAACDYQRLVMAASDGAAFAYEAAGGSSPAGTAAPAGPDATATTVAAPIAVVAGLGGLLVALVAAFLFVVRRDRRRS